MSATLETDGVHAGLTRATLLVPAAKIRDGETAIQIRRGAAGRRPLVCAFTDLEALQAWDRNPPETAVALDAASVAGLPAPTADVGGTGGAEQVVL